MTSPSRERSPNLPKYLSYTEAWRRIKSAHCTGFYFEVVTICESIISDRLLSFVSAKSSSNIDTRVSFADLTKRWRKLAAGPLPRHGDADLGTAIDLWREERNTIVHGLVKSSPGTPTAPVEEFVQRAKKAADDGVALAKAVQRWHRQQLKSHQASLPASSRPL